MKKKKLGTFRALVIKLKSHDREWSNMFFFNDESARNYFDEICKKNKWDFNWNDYEVVAVNVSLA